MRIVLVRLGLLLLTVFLCVGSVMAQSSDAYNYTYYRAADGLCDEYVFHVYRDSRGFMWFCTSNGLDRFDGNDYVHYNTQAQVKEHRTKSNFFISMEEDGSGFLWAISDMGLMRISPEDGAIVQASEIYDDKSGLLSMRGAAIMKDTKGALWLGVEGHVLHLVMGDKGDIRGMDVFKSKGHIVQAFCQQENTVWAGSRDGLSRFMLTSDGHSHTMPLEDGHELGGLSNVRTLASQGAYLYVGTTDSGLYRYNLQTQDMLNYRHNPSDSNSLTGNYVSSISMNQSGDLVVGTRSGISILTRGNGFLRLQAGRPGLSLNNNQINHVYVDGDNNMWAATALGGVNLISIRKSNVTTVFGSDDFARTNVVTAVCRDSRGNILGGVSGLGLGFLAADGSNGGKPYYFGKDLADERYLSDDHVLAITEDESGGYWIGTKNGGLNYMCGELPSRPKFVRFNTKNSSIRSNSIYSFAPDSIRGGFWICFDDGVQFFNTSTREFKDLAEYVGDVPPMSNMMSVMLGSDGRLWVGGDGLFVADLEKRDPETALSPYIYCRYKLDDPDSGISERVSVIRQIEDSLVYIGSQNNGLYIATYNRDGGISFVNHLSIFGNKISNIVKGSNKCVWISTIDGVYYFDRETLRTIKYDTSDGLPSNQFYIKSGTDLPGGRVCLGSVRGAVAIDPPSYLSMAYERRVILTYVLSGEDNVRQLNADTYELSPDETSIEIGFSAQEYVHPDKVMYAYKIDELDNHWTVERQAKRIRYTGMKPGKYTFLIHCTNSDNLWSSQMTRLNIVVKAPFYQTWWFYSLVVFVVVSVVGLTVYFYFRRQKSIQKLSLTKIRQRTRRLTEQTAQLRQKNEEISSQKTQLEEFSKQIENTNREKLMMFTSLTHEFKTPLTLILGPTRKLIEGNENPGLSESIQIIDRNAHHLLSLVNQMMDLRLIDARHLTLNREPFNIVDEFNGDIKAFSDLIAERCIDFSTRERIVNPFVSSDRGFLHKILFNLMSNAIKYTPNGGSIVCRLAQRRSDDPQVLYQYISVTNSGSYISPEECGRIFDCFYKIENQTAYTSYGQSSTGIGLYLVKQIVQALDGDISVKSVPGSGTTFRICFPLTMASGMGSEATVAVAERVLMESEAEDIAFNAPDERDKPVVLLVEDSRDMRTYIKDLLEGKYYVAESINGERGYAMARKIAPDFIISDMMMPVCDGLEFCRLVRDDAELSHIPFLMLTALSDYDSRFESYKSSVDAYLTKPFEPEMLLARIEAILVNRRNQQNLISADLSNPYPSVEIEDADKIFLSRLVEVMRTHYSDPDFSVGTLVDMMGMSAPKLYHKINALTGMSAVSYIRLYRLQTARRIMEENRGKSGISVSEIAYLVGFNDPKYFTRCFVKQFGIQPRTFLNSEV